MSKYIWKVTLSTLLVINIYGCGNSTTSNNDENTTLESAEAEMEVSFIRHAANLVIDGALGEIGSKSMGLILDLLLGEDTSQQEALDSMNDRLDTISTELNVIENELSEINREIEISTEQIIANTNDPTDAINAVNNALNAFEASTDSLAIGMLSSSKACDISNDFLNNRQIQDQVNNIFSAIVPSSSVKDSVFTNYMNLNMQRISSNYTLYDGYYSLERYTSQLLYFQVQALNLTAEAYNVPHTVGNNGCNTSESDIAHNYAIQFIEKRRQELWDPNEPNSFISNVWNYALNTLSVDDFEANSANFDYQKMLQRAEFYRRLAIDDVNYIGANFMLISTNDVTPHLCVGKEGWENYKEAVISPYTISYNIQGPAYPKWKFTNYGDDSEMQKSTDYTVWLFNFDVNESGIYYPFDCNTVQEYGLFDVNIYNESYGLDGNTSIPFGMGFATRSANGEYNNPHTSDWDLVHNANVDAHFEEDDIYRVLSGKADSNTAHETYSGNTQYYIPFTYTGNDDDNVTLHYDFDISYHIETSPNAQYNAKAEAKLYVGLHDRTEEKYYSCDGFPITHSINSQSADNKEDKKHYSYKDYKLCSVSLVKGHEYSFYIQGHIYGDSGGV